MLICIGGFPGSGKHALARYVAEHLGYYYYDINQKKLPYPVLTQRGVHEKLQQPDTDEKRTLLYQRIVKDFPLLSKMYPDMVIDSAFHRIHPRDAFFREARQYFDDVLVLWVESDAQEGAWQGIDNSEASVRKEKLIRKEFQPFDVPVPTFSYSGSIDAAQEAFCEFVRKESGMR